MPAEAPPPMGGDQLFGPESIWRRAVEVTGLALRRTAPLAVLTVLLIAIGLFQPSFLSLNSFSVLAGESSVILLMATAQTIVILLGGIDLSTAALASLTSVLIALLLPSTGVGGVVGVLALSAGIGAGQGYIHARAQVPSFVVTLAGLGLWLSLIHI